MAGKYLLPAAHEERIHAVPHRHGGIDGRLRTASHCNLQARDCRPDDDSKSRGAASDAVKDLPLDDVYRLLEPGPVVLLTTCHNGPSVGFELIEHAGPVRGSILRQVCHRRWRGAIARRYVDPMLVSGMVSGWVKGTPMMHSTRGRNRRRWWVGFVQAGVLSAIPAIDMTWAVSTYDHPIDQSIMAGMATRECAEVRAMRAGSLLLTAQPDNDVCGSVYLYRTTFPDDADDAHSYTASVMQHRISEFHQLVGYVFLTWLAVVGVVIGVTDAVRLGYQRYWRGTRPQEDQAHVRRFSKR